MKKDEFISKVTAIGTCEDDVQRRTLLTELQEEAEKDYDNFEQLTSTNATLSQENEEIRKANLKLFQRLGQNDTSTEDEVLEDKKKEVTESYEDIYKKKGVYR